MGIRSPLQQQRRSLLALSLIILAVLLVVGAGAFVFINAGLLPTSKPGTTPTSTSTSTSIGLGIITEPGGERIGISDGSYVFDNDRPDWNLKTQGSDALRKGNVTSALSFWQQALGVESNDAEALIYIEDQRILASKAPYITLVVGTMLTGGPSNMSAGRDNLQGAYVAQKEYNDGSKLNGGLKIRLLIASAGSQPAYATTVAQQIVVAAKRDPTIVGVMGWPFSSYALNAVKVLSMAHIPMVSPTASSDALTEISKYFFRVAPSNKYQASVGAKYAETQLNATRAAIFVDPNDPYSSSLANDFSQQFTNDGYQIVATQHYTVGQTSNLLALLQNALSVQPNPNLIYFAGYAQDMAVLLTDLPPSISGLQLLGGDALYELGGYSSSSGINFNRLRFTSFAYPDEWDILGYHSQKPAFFTEYASNFDPNMIHQSNPYGFRRPDSDVILSYDATLALLQGSENALLAGTSSLTPDILQQNLAGLNGPRALQGVSGQISFGPDNDPMKKAIVVLYVDPNGFIKLSDSTGVQGCFLVGQC